MTSITRRTVLSGGAALAGAVISPPFAPAAVGNQKSHSGKTLVHLTVNGHARELELDPRTTVLDALREHLLLTGTKKGRDQGQCGACTVHINGERVLSCLSLALAAEGFVSQQAVRIFRQRITEEELGDAFERFQYQPRALIDLVFLYASGPVSSFSDILNVKVQASLSAQIARPQFDALTPLQRQIAERLADGGDVSSIEARRIYAKALKRKSVSPGSINNALKALIQKHIISKPLGSHGGYTFDDAAFREWLRVAHQLVTHKLPLVSCCRQSNTDPIDEVKLTHLGEDGSFFEAADVDPGASSGDTSDGPTGRRGKSDRQASGMFPQHRAAVFAQRGRQAIPTARAAAV